MCIIRYTHDHIFKVFMYKIFNDESITIETFKESNSNLWDKYFEVYSGEYITENKLISKLRVH